VLQHVALQRIGLSRQSLCGMLHCIAVCCSVLQCVAACSIAMPSRDNIRHDSFTCLSQKSDSVLRYVAVCCGMLQCVATCSIAKPSCDNIRHDSFTCDETPFRDKVFAVRCIVLQCVAVCCNVLQRVALQCPRVIVLYTPFILTHHSFLHTIHAYTPFIHS